MTLLAKSVKEPQNFDKERFVMKATENLQVGRYAVFRCTKEGDIGVSDGKLDDAYWFPDKVVSEGDLVVLYSKPGVISEKSIEDGKKAHFFYWCKETSMWDGDTIPVLVKISSYQFGEI